jgi:holliday junction DNA helicase RuvB
MRPDRFWPGVAENVAKPPQYADVCLPLLPIGAKSMRRPPVFCDFIGQKEAVDRLRRLGDGAQARKEAYPHCLLWGPSGLGKTLLARSLAKAYGSGFLETRGQLSREELIAKFTTVRPHDFIFIDESHLLKGTAQDLLLEIIDNLPTTPPKSKAADTRSEEGPPERIPVPPCTIVLATDQPGALCNALRKRMAEQVPLRLYRVAELKEIAENIAKNIDILISPQAGRHLAIVAHGLPRTVRHYLQGIRLMFPESETNQITLRDVKEFLSERGVDAHGLGPEDRNYLMYLHAVGSASFESLAIHLGLGRDTQFVRQEIELKLFHLKLVKIGTAGRQLTDLGKQVAERMIPGPEGREENENGDG